MSKDSRDDKDDNENSRRAYSVLDARLKAFIATLPDCDGLAESEEFRKRMQRLWFDRGTRVTFEKYEALTVVERKVGEGMSYLGAALLDKAIAQAAMKKRVVIAKPPGGWMLAIAVVFSPKARERVFGQLLHDYREENAQLLSQNAGKVELWASHARHCARFVLSFICQAVGEIAKVIKTLRGAG